MIRGPATPETTIHQPTLTDPQGGLILVLLASMTPTGRIEDMPRSKSDRLRRAESNGAVIKTKSGKTVAYDSKGRSDDKPWTDADGVRYSGSDCVGTTPE